MDVHKLLRLDGDLHSQEVEDLKFLCRDVVPQKQLDNVKAGTDLFLLLEEQGLLGEHCHFLAELLLTIQRLDLLRVLGTSKKEVEESVSRQGYHFRLPPYRKMLYELSENVTEETLRSFKFLSGLPRNRLDSCTTFLDVVVEMEKLDWLREDSMEVLQRVFGECNKQLAAKVQTYAAHLAAGGSTGQIVPGHRNSQPREKQQSHRPSVQDSSPGLSLTSVVSGEDESLSLDAASPDQHLEDYYKTSSRPLGHCLIINNFSFKEARMSGTFLKDRRGTGRDGELLRSVFSRMHFTVEERKDLTGPELRKVVREFGERDHHGLDVFVCCVLSHGDKGSVHAVDGTSVPIRALTLPFTSSRCPSLALKPKLFFIQACQGKDLQRGAPMQADGVEEEEEEEEVYSADAGRFLPDIIPDDSDFLLGMATVEDYMSFRSTSEGSIFIQQLYKQLIRGCQEKEDILTVMTRVNREVSTGVYRVLNSGVYLNSKQMPEPRYTLRKKLVLPID
ncbi:hypothetical protein SKAU_G00254110 [Synaphobranchus kaupii]|uniref:Caspase-8 n=1 Tax=Synaphobranchus kaupii TaxID=118154 RepID=A0A9Q1F3J0_SYNKA|nr:hypothetical protein SKAU_G00254110 [Synaphobranchus kaupii]